MAWLTELPADVQRGTKRDAILYSCSCNKHGKGRTNEDKRRVVERMLKDEEWGEWSNVTIAQHCGVSESLVRSLRSKRSEEKQNRTYEDRWGNVHTMDTSAIGHRENLPQRIGIVLDALLALFEKHSLLATKGRVLYDFVERCQALQEELGLPEGYLHHSS